MNGNCCSSSERRRLLLMTANVGSLFEEDRRIQNSWLDVIVQRILREDAEVAVVHMQETGGKNYVECSAQVPVLINMLAEQLRDTYPVCFAFLDLNYDGPAYTALGSLVFVRDSCVDLEQFDFTRREFVAVSPSPARIDIVTDTLEDEPRVRKEKFPKNFWPAFKWGRKGYLQTRWRLGSNRIMDFINVHLFHDESNLALIHENPMLYSDNRKRAMNFVLERCVLEGDSDVFRYFFGDMNFRLDSRSFLNRITDKSELHPLDDVHQHGSAQGLESNSLGIDDLENGTADTLRRTVSVSAIEFHKRDTTANGAKENGSSVIPPYVLRIEKKKFDYVHPIRLLTEWHKYLEDDKEVKGFPELHEMPISFPPTYPWSEDPTEFDVLMKTRAPAWCDRVLLNEAAFVELDKDTAVYESIGGDVCMGDHKPVLLALDVPV